MEREKALQDLIKSSVLALDIAKQRINKLENEKNESIAIIGMSCRFPNGANNPELLWDLLKNGQDGIIDMTDERWPMDYFYDRDPDAINKMNTKSAGLLNNISDFDADFFSINAEEAKHMDPQQRILLETTWHALENASCDIVGLREKSVGVFIGMMNHDYAEISHGINGYTGSGTAASIASGRISYLLGLTGPSITIDSACSSSLVALHYAIQSIRCGESEFAIVGGVNVIISPKRMLAMSKAKMLSPTGRCHAFSNEADGYVRAEGCGVVVLKKLSEAIQNQDNILAVIRGSAVNQDGRSQGLTAPNGPAQQKLIETVLKQNRLDPKSLDYVEAHGTGTALGDPLELQALNASYATYRPSGSPLLVGSIKSNIGHTESAAGIASLIKVILSLKKELIPANLHFINPNQYIAWDEINIKIVDKNTPWLRKAVSRMAAISSFGFSGTNAHVVLEEAPRLLLPDERNPTNDLAHMLLISAKTEQALSKLVESYYEMLNQNETDSLENICFTAALGRSHLHFRIAFIADSKINMSKKISQYLSGQSSTDTFTGKIENQFTGDILIPGISTNDIPSLSLLRELAVEYCKGRFIDWTKIYDKKQHQRVNLPNYPFARKHYWLQQEYENIFMENENLVLEKIPLSDNTLIYLVRVTSKSLLLFSHHLVLEKALLPGAFYINLISELASELGVSEDLILANIVFHKILKLDIEPVIIQVIFKIKSMDNENEKSEYDVQIFSYAPKNETNRICHFSASLQKISQKRELVREDYESEIIGDAESFEFTGVTLYQVAAKARVCYGSSLSVITKQIIKKNKIITELNMHQLRLSNQKWLQTLILDACFQSFSILLYGEDTKEIRNYCFLPVSIHEINLLAEFDNSQQLKILATVTKSSDDFINAHVIVFDSKKIYISMEEVMFQKISHERISEILGQERYYESLLTSQWKEQVNYSPYFASYYFKKIQQDNLNDDVAHAADEVEINQVADLQNLSIKIIIYALAKLGFNFSKNLEYKKQFVFSQVTIIDRYIPLLYRMFDILHNANLLLVTDESIKVTSNFSTKDIQKFTDDIFSEDTSDVDEVKFLKACGRKLSEVLKGDYDPLDLLFPSFELVGAEKVYQNSSSIRNMNEMISIVLPKKMQELPRCAGIKILEIGAGTGSTTSTVLSQLQGERIRYYFTDVSPLFIQKAQEKFKNYPFLLYHILNIELDPLMQGFNPNDFDIIIAGNVLHTTKDLTKSLEHIQKLLVPQGLLILQEMTSQQAWLDLTFGLTEGWWRFQDTEIREKHALLSGKQWLNLLNKMNFHAIQLNPASSTESLIIAQSNEKFELKKNEKYLILADRSKHAELFKENLEKLGIDSHLLYRKNHAECLNADVEKMDSDSLIQFRTVFKTLLDSKPASIKVVSFWGLDTNLYTLTSELIRDINILCRTTRIHIPIIRSLLLDNNVTIKLWVVTENAQAINELQEDMNIFDAPLWGVNKSLSFEYPDFNLTLLDIDRNEHNVKHLLHEVLSKNDEKYIAYRNGSRFVARLQKYVPPDRLKNIQFYKESTYIIAGGTKGLGLLTLEWMFNKAARNFVIFSRHKPEAENQAIIDKLRQCGANIFISQTDISEYKALAQLFSDIKTKMPPIKGVIDSVGVLSDGIFIQQTWHKFSDVLKPKVMGAWNLHLLTNDLSLDFFVMYSSIASLLGSAGQANHAAANAFLDTFSYYLRKHNRPATTINWGVWSEVGAAEQKGVANRLIEEGNAIKTISRKQGYAFLDLLWSMLPTQVAAIPIDWELFLRANEKVSQNPFFSEILSSVDEKNIILNIQTKNIKSLLVNKNKRQTRQILFEHLRAKLTLLLKLNNPEKIGYKTGLFHLGLDSLLAVEFRNYLQRELEFKMRPTLLFDFPTLEQLIEFILSELNNSLETETNTLSEDELEKQLLAEIERENLGNVSFPEVSENII